MTKRIRSRIWEDQVPFTDSFSELANLLVEEELPFEIGSFDDFVQNIFSLSYPQYDFNTWHVRYLCSIVDEILASPNKLLLVVLPRYHIKSTILGYASSIYRFLTSYGDSLFLSYKEELSLFHLSNIKTAINNNPQLAKAMIDLHSKSESAIAYKIGSKRVRMFSSGIFAVKRGLHTDGIVIADDVIGDIQNPMTFTELEKTKRLFYAEVMNIPNKNCPLFVYGTVIDYSDLLYELKENPQFRSIWLPALYPDGEHDVLWEAMYPKEWLENQKAKIGWRAFSTEFLLTPVVATNAFISREELDKVIDKSLVNFQVPGF